MVETIYLLLFAALAVLAAGLELTKSTDQSVVKSPTFLSFRNNYILVYSLMMGEPAKKFVACGRFCCLRLT